MSQSLSYLFGTLLLGAAGSVIAASSVDLGIIGLITPSACEPSLSNGGVYDLGRIAANALNKDQPTALPAHLMQLTVRCDALTLVALQPTDNRLGSSSDSATPTKFGLGLINGSEKLGSMSLNMRSVLVDSVAARPIGSTEHGTWAPASVMSPHFMTSVSNGSVPLMPLPLKLMTADLQIRPTIAPAATLTLTEQVPIDGSVTLTVNYL